MITDKGHYDIICLCETWLRNNDGISVPGYTWYGNNRKVISKRAIRGSGGVGLLIKSDLLSIYNVTVLDSSFEGSLWIQFESKNDCFKYAFCVCVCYLPPSTSCRGDISDQFFDNLATQTFIYSCIGPVCICGDFNARCGNLADGCDPHPLIPTRCTIDDTANSNGKQLMDFLRAFNLCMLNGRGKKDNFTYVSSLGRSVVDCCLVHKDDFHMYSNFTVKTPSELVSEHNYKESKGIPDHSILTWQLSIEGEEEYSSHTKANKECTPKFLLHKVPRNFMSSKRSTLYNLTLPLNSPDLTQITIDQVYNEFCNLVLGEMELKIPKIKCRTNHKPWWNPKLGKLRRNMYMAEKKWLNCKDKTHRNQLQQLFKAARREYTYFIRKAKRNYVRTIQSKLMKDHHGKQADFWSLTKTFLGPRRATHSLIPLQIIENERVISSLPKVLEKWCNDFSGLLTAASSNDKPSAAVTTIIQNDAIIPWENYVTHEEVKQAVLAQKNKKAPGLDNIPAEVLKNVDCIRFLTDLFTACIKHCKIPSKWKTGLIKPIPKNTNNDPRIPLNY